MEFKYNFVTAGLALRQIHNEGGCTVPAFGPMRPLGMRSRPLRLRTRTGDWSHDLNVHSIDEFGDFV